MSNHDDLLKQGPREAPEPETAEERSRKLGLKTAGGVAAGGAVVAAKAGALGGFSKLFLWLFVWHSVNSGWRISAWIGIAVVLVAGSYVYYRHHRSEA